MFSRIRKEYVTVEEFNKHLKYCEHYRHILHRAKSRYESFALFAFLEDKEIMIKLSYKKGDKACTYITWKDNREITQQVDGGEAFRILSRYYKVPRFEDEEILGMSASPLLYKNDKEEGKRQKAIGYDLNSAYSFAMTQVMPDTSFKPRVKKIEKGEIGFIELPTRTGVALTPIFKGHSRYVFPLMESPFKKFVAHWYKMKQDSKTKAKAKGILNYSVGYLQKVNPFLRATIIGYCNNYIKSLIDDDVLYCNTDSIVTKRPREDFKIGKELGEWKIEHEGEFAFVGFNYQWNLEVPSYRGFAKSWFKEGWDILKDKLPACGNVYELKDYQLVRRENVKS